MQKWIMFSLFIAACLLGTGVLFKEIAVRQSEMAAEEAAGPQIKLIATNYKFDQAEYTATAGEAVTLSFLNKEGMHAVHISGNGVDIKLDNNNKSQEVTFTEPGTYNVECSLPCGEGHAQMKAVIVVQ